MSEDKQEVLVLDTPLANMAKEPLPLTFQPVILKDIYYSALAATNKAIKDNNVQEAASYLMIVTKAIELKAGGYFDT